MPEFLIEREMPGVGRLAPQNLKHASRASCSVLGAMGPGIQWVQSWVTDDKLYCVYRASDEDLIREHGRRGGSPVNKVSQVRSTISPITAQ